MPWSGLAPARGTIGPALRLGGRSAFFGRRAHRDRGHVELFSTCGAIGVVAADGRHGEARGAAASHAVYGDFGWRHIFWSFPGKEAPTLRRYSARPGPLPITGNVFLFLPSLIIA